ncbi:MAG: prephenate dehydrogenase [Pirellulales bacterium]|nr:prephenate dehydrogenase [Pirellulales bacterium]
MGKPLYSTVAIVGVGLIGGSLGLALRERKLARRVVGIGRHTQSLAEAESLGAISVGTTDLAAGVKDAELIILATPVASIVPLAREIASLAAENAIMTDCGSTKRQIVRDLVKNYPRGIQFVGSHPLAGGEKQGPLAAKADLLNGKYVVLTPGTKQSAESSAVLAVADFWTSLGATVVFMSPREHDKSLAAVSHLPHLAAAALARMTSMADLPLCATGWRDTTRIAAGDARLWTEIALSNQDYLVAALEKYQRELALFTRALAVGDTRKLEQLFQQAKERRDAVGS